MNRGAIFLFTMAMFALGIALATDSIVKGLLIGVLVPTSEFVVTEIIYTIDNRADK